mmetsp:Transcript_141/g.340  ORF Transcript_141/g.340 Transcript_141/m.340 type:complete len:203 (+) Transcript_141:244-852(+)
MSQESRRKPGLRERLRRPARDNSRRQNRAGNLDPEERQGAPKREAAPSPRSTHGSLCGTPTRGSPRVSQLGPPRVYAVGIAASILVRTCWMRSVSTSVASSSSLPAATFFVKPLALKSATPPTSEDTRFLKASLFRLIERNLSSSGLATMLLSIFLTVARARTPSPPARYCRRLLMASSIWPARFFGAGFLAASSPAPIARS